MSKVDWTVWQKPEVAGAFADRRANLPGATLQFDVLRRLTAAVKHEPLCVLDIGCGDGALLAKVMESRRVSHAVALDGSAAMLQRARKRFAKNDDVKFVQADFNDANWPAKLPAEPFDVIVSGFAIHHSEDEQKRQIYAQIFQLLAPGGVFVNIEHVASATPFGERLWNRAWTEYDVAYRRASGEQIEFDAVLAEFLASDQRAANRLTPVETQLQWLREIGFADVDCYCKYLELAVLAGYRRS
jgi:tRNA (cmo5U34)-methyltransferase